MIDQYTEKKFNEHLKHERLLRGWTQQDIADQVGTDGYTVSRWERGRVVPSPYFRQKLCELFGKNAEELGLLCETHDRIVHDASSSIWAVPHHRNAFFTGREQVLGHVQMQLQQGYDDPCLLVQALCGMGGIGKTQTVLEYAYRFRHTYHAVLWVQATTYAMLQTSCLALLQQIENPLVDEDCASRHAVRLLKAWLSQHCNWLLIIDDLEDFTLLAELLPTISAGHTLVTTRLQYTGTLAQRIALSGLEVDEGALLLLRRAKRLSRTVSLEEASCSDCRTARTLSTIMDGLPLALDQAGAYIEETACSVADYLACYQHNQPALLQRRGSGSAEHPQSVSTTLSLSFEQLAQRNLAAADLLRVCLFLDADAIPEEIIAQGAAKVTPSLRSLATDSVLLDAAFHDLRLSSFVERQPETKMLSIHRLMQATLKIMMDEKTQRHWAECAVRIIERALRESASATCERWKWLLPHVHACVDLIERWHMAFPEAAQLLYKAAHYLQIQTQYTEAEALYQQTLAMQQSLPDMLGHAFTAFQSVQHSCSTISVLSFPSKCS